MFNVNRHFFVLLMLMALISCKRAPVSPTTIAISPAKTEVQMQTITQLPPNRTVHVAVDSLGNVFYTIETDSGHDGMVVVSQSGIPRATQLTSENILAALGETVGGNGAIQSIVPATDGSIFFYFVGGKGKSVRACIGQYRLAGEIVRILFDTQMLLDKSEMGQSIDLARGTLLLAQHVVYLFLRHSDSAVILNFSLTGSASLSRMTTPIRLDNQPLDLTRDQYDLFKGWGDNLLLMDKSVGQLLEINMTSGAAKSRINLAGLPRDLSSPIASATDHLIVFASNSEPLDVDQNDLSIRPALKISYPALLQISGNDITGIGRDDLHAYGGFPIYAMRVHEIVTAPDGSLIAYDMSSGLLMQLRLSQ
jgi:hypothetical protein